MLKIDSSVKQISAIKEYLKNLKLSNSDSFISISNIRLFKYFGDQNPYLKKQSLYLKYHFLTATSERDVFIEIKKNGEVNPSGDSIVTPIYSKNGTLKNITCKQKFKMEELSEVELINDTIHLLKQDD